MQKQETINFESVITSTYFLLSILIICELTVLIYNKGKKSLLLFFIRDLILIIVTIVVFILNLFYYFFRPKEIKPENDFPKFNYPIEENEDTFESRFETDCKKLLTSILQIFEGIVLILKLIVKGVLKFIMAILNLIGWLFYLIKDIWIALTTTQDKIYDYKENFPEPEITLNDVNSKLQIIEKGLSEIKENQKVASQKNNENFWLARIISVITRGF